MTKPLSAEDARWLVIPRKAYVAGVDVDAIDDKLEAIRDGHHKCIAVCTEAEARAWFKEYARLRGLEMLYSEPHPTHAYTCFETDEVWSAAVAALKWAGKIEDKQS